MLAAAQPVKVSARAAAAGAKCNASVVRVQPSVAPCRPQRVFGGRAPEAPKRAQLAVVASGNGNGAEIDPTSYPACTPAQMKKLYQDKGYIVLDVRTPQENAEGSKKWFTNLPIAFETEQGPAFNKKFRAQIQKEFANRMSRIIVACDDGSDRTALTCEVLAELGYTNVMTLEGGVNAYLAHDPLTAADKKPVWKLTGQTSGVRYAYNDGDGDDSA